MTTVNTHSSKRNNDSIHNTILMALLVSLVCSVLVSTTVALLAPIQRQHQLARSSLKNILPLLGAMQLDIDPDTISANLEVKAIELETGEYSNTIDVASFNPREAVKDPALSIIIPKDKDTAGIAQRSKYAVVYLIKEGSVLKYVLLPIYGRGMWSTLYGYIALEGDGKTIAAIKFYEHGETPGIGDRIDESSWLQQWRGKLAYDNNHIAIRVLKRQTPTTSPYEVDAIAGATITSNGVSNVLRYWLGEHGFHSFLKTLHSDKEDR